MGKPAPKRVVTTRGALPGNGTLHGHIAARLAPMGVDVRGGPDACWPWTRPVHRSGYVRFTVEGRPVSAGRFVWMLSHGVEPRGGRVWRTCQTRRRCLNPSHLCDGPRRPWLLGRKALANLRRLRGDGMDLHVLARRYRMTAAAIEHVVRMGRS